MEESNSWVFHVSSGVKEGSRNDTAMRLGIHYFKNFDGNVSKTLSALKKWNEKNIPPLDLLEINKALDSVVKKSSYSIKGKPRNECQILGPEKTCPECLVYQGQFHYLHCSIGYPEENKKCTTNASTVDEEEMDGSFQPIRST